MNITPVLGFSQHPKQSFARGLADLSALRRARALESEAASYRMGPYFKVLGYNRGRFYYLPRGADSIISLTTRQHQPLALLRLAPIEYWKSRWRRGRQACDWPRAICALFRTAEAVGLYFERGI